jgi:hypothetical protein
MKMKMKLNHCWKLQHSSGRIAIPPICQYRSAMEHVRLLVLSFCFLFTTLLMELSNILWQSWVSYTPIHCVIIVKHFSKSKVRRLGTVNFLYPFVSKKMSTFDLTKWIRLDIYCPKENWILQNKYKIKKSNCNLKPTGSLHWK